MHSIDEFARNKLASLEASHLRRTMKPTRRLDDCVIERDGRHIVSFSCNDSLGLARHPAVIAAAMAAIQQHGVGAGASRLVTGDNPLNVVLEQRLARLKGSEAAAVFGSGYLVNTGVPQTLVGRGDLIVIDELAHSSLWTGARLSRAEVVAFRHNDAAHAHTVLATLRGRHGRALLVTEGVFSMDGDRAPLEALSALARQHDAWLLVDDAHDLDFDAAARADVPLRIGTLSKSLGAYGGYLCASEAVIDLMRNRARTLIYSTGLPPGVLSAAIAAVDVIEQEPDRLAAPFRKALSFTRAAGLPDAQSSIVPVLIGPADSAVAASHRLEEAGYLAVAIRPPTVPEGTARLRLSFSASHSDDDVRRLASLVRALVIDRR